MVDYIFIGSKKMQDDLNIFSKKNKMLIKKIDILKKSFSMLPKDLFGMIQEKKTIDESEAKRKLKIGVDIDGVLYDFHDAFKIYLHNKHSKPLEEMSEPDGWLFYEKWGMCKEEFLHFFKMGINDEFIFKYGKMLDGASEYLKKIKKMGHSIHLVSNRKIEDAEHKSLSNTVHWLNENEISFDTLDFDFEKGKYAKKYNLDIFIDDSPKHLSQLEENACNFLFLFDQKWNRKEKYEIYKRVHNWREIYEQIRMISY